MKKQTRNNKKQQRRNHKKNSKEINNKTKTIIKIFKTILKMETKMRKAIKMETKALWNNNRMKSQKLLICFMNKEIIIQQDIKK